MHHVALRSYTSIRVILTSEVLAVRFGHYFHYGWAYLQGIWSKRPSLFILDCMELIHQHCIAT